MHFNDKLIKNYILSEIYNIEKDLFLKENNDQTLSESLLEEGKIIDWFKDKISDVKEYFISDPNFLDYCKKQQKLAEKKGDKRSKENWIKTAEEYENLRSKRSNIFTAGTIFLIALSKLIPVGGTIQDANQNKVDRLMKDDQIATLAQKAAHQQMSKEEVARRFTFLVGEDLEEENIDNNRVLDQNSDTISIEGQDGKTYTMTHDEYDIFLNKNSERETFGHDPIPIEDFYNILEKNIRPYKKLEKEGDDFTKSVLSYNDDGTTDIDYDKIISDSEEDSFSSMKNKINALELELSQREEDLEDEGKEVPLKLKKEIKRIEDLTWIFGHLDDEGCIKDGWDEDLVRYSLRGENNEINDETLAILRNLIDEDNL